MPSQTSVSNFESIFSSLSLTPEEKEKKFIYQYIQRMVLLPGCLSGLCPMS